MTTIKRGANRYEIKQYKQGDDDYPYFYTLYMNGKKKTEGGGAGTKEQARQEALADIDELEHEYAEMVDNFKSGFNAIVCYINGVDGLSDDDILNLCEQVLEEYHQ